MDSPSGGSHTSPILVGRASESERVDASLASMLDGRPRSVVISGEAGIGKTRLIDDALTRTSSEVRVLRAGCLALTSDLPYLPFAELLRDLARQVPSHALATIVGPARAELSIFVPELAGAGKSGRHGSEHGRTGRSDELDRLRLYETFLRVAERISADRPTVFVIEDIQWIDAASLELLAFLAHGISQRSRATLFVSVRPEELEARDGVLSLLAEIGHDSDTERIELGPLGPADVRRLARALAADATDDGLIEHVAALSDGNPLFIEELLAASRRGEPTPQVPPRLRDLLAARLAHVSDEVLTVLRVAAAAGRGADDQLLTTVSGIDEMAVHRAVRSALDEKILVHSDSPGGPGYRFRHEIMRSLVEAQLLPAERRAVHAACARTLSQGPRGTGQATEIALHWDAAGDIPQAFVAHLEAGTVAAEAFAFEQAQHHFERVLELWDRVDDPAARCGERRTQVLDRVASAAARAGDFSTAITRTREIMAQPEALDREAFELARSSLRWYLWESGDYAAARNEAEAVLADDSEVAPRWRANALGHLAALLLYEQRPQEAEPRATEARDLAISVEALEEQILAEGVLGWCLLLGGDLDAGIDAIRRAAIAAGDSESSRLVDRYPVGAALAHAQLAVALEMAGHFDESYETAREGSAIAGEQGVTRTFGSALEATAARALYQLGRWDEVIERVDAALAGGAVGSGRIALLALRTSVLVARGQGDEAARSLVEAEGLVDDATPPDVRRWLTAAQVETSLWQGDPTSALALLALAADDAEGPVAVGPGWRPAMPDASIPQLLVLGARASAELAVAERAAGDKGGLSTAAATRLRSSLDRIRRRGALATAWAGDLAVVRAELDEHEPQQTRLRRWKTARDLVAARPYLAAYCGWRLAQAQLAHRDGRQSAAQTIESALQLARGLKASILVAQLDALARRARLTVATEAGLTSVSTASAVRPFGLTERELEVLALLADGLSNQEIADALFISPKTASVHVSNIYAKLGVESRVAAATLAHSVGITSDAGTAGTGDAS